MYYYNTVSEESAWERPPDFKGDTEKVAEQPVPSSSNVVLGTAWSEVKCLDGRVYYYNSESEVGLKTASDQGPLNPLWIGYGQDLLTTRTLDLKCVLRR